MQRKVKRKESDKVCGRKKKKQEDQKYRHKERTNYGGKEKGKTV